MRPTDYNTPPRKRRVRHAPTSRPETAGNPNVAHAPAPPPPTHAPAAPPGPFTDAERKAVAKNRRTPAYRGAIKVAYKQGTAKQRRATREHIAETPKSERTPEQRTVRQVHTRFVKAQRAAALVDALHYRINSRPASTWNKAERTFMRQYSAGQRAAQESMSSQIFTDDQRRAVHRFDIHARAHYTPPVPEHLKQSANDIFETDPKKLAALGFHKDNSLANEIVSAPKYALGALASGGAYAEATFHDPLGVTSKTIKQGLKALPAIPGGVLDLVEHPAKTISTEAKAFAGRGSKPYAARVKDIEQHGGLNYLSDAATVLGAGSGAAANHFLRAGLKDGERIAVRTSGGMVRVPKSRGLISDVVRRTDQRYRARGLDKRLTAAEAGGKPMEAVAYQAAKANREAGRVVEVPARFQGLRQHRLVSKERGRGIYGFRSDKGRRTKADAKAINRLNPKEKKAFYYADVFGIRNADQARHVLVGTEDRPGLLPQIKANRKRDGVQVTGTLKKSDMVPEIEAILKDPEQYFTERLGQVVESLREDSARAAAEDPRLHPFVERRRRYAPLAQALGLEKGVLPEAVASGQVPGLRYVDESDEAFIDRVAQHVKDLGLAEPLYFKSERYVGPTDFAPHALGGLHATKRGRAYEGKNLAVGLQDTRPSMYLLGKAANIKAKHNWNMVADILEHNAIKELAPDHPAGTTVSALRESMAQKGVDMNSVALWNPGVYRKLAQDVNEPTGPDFALPEEYDNANVTTAMQHSVVRLDRGGHAVDGTGLPVDAAKLQESSGWHVVPVEVLRELEAQMKPSGKVGRMWDIAKGKASRAMLLSGNIPWLGFQVASNIAVAAAATGGRALNPANWVQAARWWHDLTPEKRDEIGGKLGLDATGADSHQIKLGASTNSDLVNMYRAFKAQPFWHTGVAKGRGPSLSELNPFELMARADRGQNNITRIIAGYSLAKRDTVRRMGESMGRADRAQLKLTSILAKPPAEQLRELANDPSVLENHAEAIADWMGDYTSMTATERKVINRAVMFMPYLRYSLRLLFYTMPVKHPTVTAVLADLGEMRADELEKLFGKGELPWNLGKIYFGSGGHVKSIDLKRANPALNSIIDAATNHNLAQLVGIAPPWTQWIYDQMSQTSSYTGKAWKYNGHAAPYGNPRLPLLSGVRGRVLADDILGLTFPYREAEKLTQSGPQGDDSTLLFGARPTVYKGNTALGKLERKFGKRRTRFQDAHESLWTDLLPGVVPQPDRNPAEVGREDRIIARATPKPGHHARRAKPHYFGGGSSGGHYFGGS